LAALLSVVFRKDMDNPTVKGVQMDNSKPVPKESTIEDLVKKFMLDSREVAISVGFPERLYVELDRKLTELRAAAGIEITEEEIIIAALREYLDMTE
jgi:hypothetical protein